MNAPLRIAGMPASLSAGPQPAFASPSPAHAQPVAARARAPFSVLMSLYRAERPAHLRAALESVLRQTEVPAQIVLVKDGPCGDALDEIVEEYAERHGALFTVVPLPENVGLGRALAAGMAACRHALIARMDTDDIAVPNRFARQLDFLDSHPGIAVVGTWIAEFDDDPDRPYAVRRLPLHPESIARFATRRNPLNHMTVMFRRAAVEAVGGYRDRAGFEDYHLWSRLLRAGARLANLPEPLVYARAGEAMVCRRGGWRYMKSELALLDEFRRERFVGLGDYVRGALTRTIVRIAPPSARAWAYRRLLRRRLSCGPWSFGFSARSALADAPPPPAARVPVSVLMSVYARDEAHQVAEALASIERQTAAPAEIVVVEDGPVPREVSAVLDRFGRVLPALKRVVLPENVGLGEALRVGLLACSHEIVARMDADDVCRDDRFARQFAYLEAHPDVAAVGSWIVECEGTPEIGYAVREVPTDPEAVRRFARMRNPLNHMTVMMRRSAVLAAGSYEPTPFIQDYSLWVRMLARGERIANIAEPLVYARAGRLMVARRGGLRYLKVELGIQRAFLRCGFISRAEFVRNVVGRFGTRVVPDALRRLIYLHLLRERA